MKKSLLAIAILATLLPLAFSMEANAERKPKDAKALIEESLILGPATGGGGTGAMYLNGIKFQGIKFQGIRFNGWRLNGMNMQATKLQGMELQNLKVEGGQLVAVTRVAGETPLSKLPVSAYED